MQPMTPKQRRESIKLANAVWSRLNYCLNNQTHYNYGDRLMKLATDDEKRHRNGFPSALFNASVADCARHILVSTFGKLLTGYQGTRMPAVADFIRIREDWFLTASLIQNYRKEIKACFKDKAELQACAELDYAALVATPGEEPAKIAA